MSAFNRSDCAVTQLLNSVLMPPGESDDAGSHHVHTVTFSACSGVSPHRIPTASARRVHSLSRRVVSKGGSAAGQFAREASSQRGEC